MKSVRQTRKGRHEEGGAGRWNHRFWPRALGRLAKAWAVLAIVGLLTALAAACGGGAEPEPKGTSTGTPTGDNAVLGSCQALQAFQTYRYSLTLKFESPEPQETPAESRPTPNTTLTRTLSGPLLFEQGIEAEFVAPDRIGGVFTTQGSPASMIIIDGRTWIEEEKDQWTETKLYEVPYKPPDVCEAILSQVDFSQVEPKEEKVNDVKTLHYTLSRVPSQQAMAKIFGATSDMAILITTVDVDFWVAEKDNWPVRMDIGGSGLYADGRELRVNLSIQVRDVNSDDIRVEPPS